MYSDDLGELTPEDLSALEILEAETAAPAWRTHPKRKRQTYQRRYAGLVKVWDQTFRSQAALLAYTRALSHARSLDIRAGRIEHPTTPDDSLVDWYRRTIIRNYRDKVRASNSEFWRSRGVDGEERKRMKWRNSKLKTSAERYNAGARSQLYNTARKLMSPEEMKAHDKEKRRLAQKARRTLKKASVISQC